MKKTLFLYLFLFFYSFPNLCAQNSAVLSGKITNAQGKALGMNLTPIFLQGQQPDYVVELASNNEFNIHLNPMDAPRIVTLLHGKRNIEVYIEPGDSVFVDIDMNQFNKKTSFEGGDINNFFFSELPKSIPTQKKALLEKQGGPKEYRALMDSVIAVQHQLLEEYANTHTISEEAMNFGTLQIDYQYANHLLTYVFNLNRRRGKQPSVDKDYFSFLEEMIVENPALANLQAYSSFLNNYMTYQLLVKMRKTPRYDASKYYADLCAIDRATIKDKFLLSMILTQHLVEGLQRSRVEDLKEHYLYAMENTKTEKYTIAVKYVYDQVKHLEAGTVAPDFKVLNIDGEEVALSDFIGKVVYMDFWASWCGPCKQQIPHAKKLKEKFHDKDVVFLYLSIDKNEKQWRDFVTNKELSGVQLIAGKEKNNISQVYRVSGVPKYILVDKEGKIADSMAKRPSEDGIEDDIEGLLTEPVKSN
ncbi:MAG: TlpA disulfide reductase family protein [Chitinophagales bacterium]